MEWATLRSAFIRQRKRLNLTQQQVATGGRLPQSAIAKIEANDKLGPAAEIFTRAVEGLGLSLSEFFRQIEVPSAETAHGSQSSVLSNEKRARENTAVAEGTVAYGGRSIPATTDSIALQILIEGLSATLGRLEERLPKDRERRPKTRARKAKHSQGRTRRVS